MEMLRFNRFQSFIWFEECENQLSNFAVVERKERAVWQSQLTQQRRYLVVQKQSL